VHLTYDMASATTFAARRASFPRGSSARSPHNERVYIVPTPAGIGFAFLIFSIFTLGYLREGFAGTPQALVIALLVTGIVILVETNANLHGVSVTSTRCEPVRAGDCGLVEVAITNRSSWIRHRLRVRFRNGWKLLPGEEIDALAPGETRVLRIRLPTSKRGCFPLPQLWISSVYPLSLCFAWKTFSESGELVVYPQEKSRCAMPSANHQPGAEDVAGHRAYVPGDSPTRVDWKVFAKSGKLVVRTLEAPAREEIRWEDTAFLSDPEERLAQMSAWLTECVNARRRFEFVLPGIRLTEKNVRACRIALARFVPQS
jgi:hypothetical protein